MQSTTIFSILFLLLSSEAVSQATFPELSPGGSIIQKVGFTTISVHYERPAVRGRNIFGDLVPYGEIWRTGAGKCTRISFSESVLINNLKVASGTYAIFTIPGANEWTVILNSDTSLYGTGRYNKAMDVIRFQTKPKIAGRFYESFTIDIDVVPSNAVVYLSWGTTQVHFLVDTGADNKTVEFIDDVLMNGKSLKAEEYAAAVEYYFFRNEDLDKAVTLIDLAIKRNPKQAWFYNLKVDVLEKQGNYAEALRAVREELAFLEAHGQELGWDDKTLSVVVEDSKSRAADLIKRIKN